MSFFLLVVRLSARIFNLDCFLTKIDFMTNSTKNGLRQKCHAFRHIRVDPFLGYWIKRKGVRPTNKKVDAILKLEHPTTRKQLRTFIGMVNYYRDMWLARSEVLAPLTAMTSAKVKWSWTPIHANCFEVMKKKIARETLLTYPDFSKPFEIHTDASKVQLGACIYHCILL
jgi:hypothetical protein